MPAGAIASPADLETRADRLRDSAMARFEANDRRAALLLNKRALRITRHLPETSWRTVENYDDAALYHYDAREWKAAAQHQAIAVLLSCDVLESRSIFPIYVERLAWAFAKYRPHENFAPIAENPLVMLLDVELNVRKNYDVRRRYFRTIKLRNTPPGSPPRYFYKLRPETIPESCYPRPDTVQAMRVSMSPALPVAGEQLLP